MTTRLGRAGWIVMGICVLAGLSCGKDKATNPTPDPEAFSVEAESYTVSHNIGGEDIGLAYCSGASGKYVVTGLDVEDEWIEIMVSVPEAGLYDVNMRYQAYPEVVIAVKLVTEDCGGEEEPGFTLDQGGGVG
ncbi:MAG: hypothetical protein PVH52_07275 [bacterium]